MLCYVVLCCDVMQRCVVLRCDVAMLSMVKKRFKSFDTTVHGFCSTFRDWAAETGNYDQNVVEFCMAHKLHSRVEGAYMRSDLYIKRKEIMIMVFLKFSLS